MKGIFFESLISLVLIPFFKITAAANTFETNYTNTKYKIDRVAVYPSIEDQLDMQYWDQVNGTTTWKDAIAKVKVNYPKP